MFDGIDPEVRPIYVGAAIWQSVSDRLKPHLDLMAAGSGGRYIREDIERCIEAGGMQVWLAMDGADIACVLITEIIEYPRLRAMRCIGIVGKRPRRWVHLLANVEAAAKQNFNCDRMEALHQVGHERLLQTDGWRPFHLLSEKVL